MKVRLLHIVCYENFNFFKNESLYHSYANIKKFANLKMEGR